MIDIKDYKKVSLDFRRIASNMLRTEYSNPDIPLYRFKNYIDTNDIVKDIVQNAIKDVECDYTKCFIIDRGSGWAELHIPVNENEHLRAMYDYMAYIVDNNMSVLNVAHNYLCSSRKITDTIQNFIALAFKPMVDYIVDELSKLILMEEEDMGLTIKDNKGVVNVAKGGSSIVSNNIVTISDNDIESISKLIVSLKEEINKCGISEEDKENVIDDLDIIQEQVNDSISKPTRLKKAFNNVKNFLTSSTTIVGASIALGNTVTEFINMIQPIIDKI